MFGGWQRSIIKRLLSFPKTTMNLTSWLHLDIDSTHEFTLFNHFSVLLLFIFKILLWLQNVTQLWFNQNLNRVVLSIYNLAVGRSWSSRAWTAWWVPWSCLIVLQCPPASPIKAFLKLPEIAQLNNRRHLELVKCFVKPPQATSPAIQRAFVDLEETEEAHKCKNFLNAPHFFNCLC
jgi:hypothetical protein